MNVKVITVKEDVLGANDESAGINRAFVDKHRILMINIMSSPGSGKTSLIMQTINRLKGKVSMAVIEGDIASSIDAERINQQGVPAIQINTQGGCHLDANMIKEALDHFDLSRIDLILIENVGNLVCTAEFALGSHKQVMLLSIPEGDDKARKYPLMFTEADVILVNKMDTLPLFDFNMEAFSKSVRELNPDVLLFPVSNKTGDGLEQWFTWLEDALKRKRR